MGGVLAQRAIQPIPAVAPGDLRGVWELIHKFSAEVVTTHSVDIALLAGACGPGADVFAVSLRSVLLEELVRQGRLTRWRKGFGLDQAVFDLAATFPLPALAGFNPDDLLQQLDAQSAR
jgi:hypothetical protein